MFDFFLEIIEHEDFTRPLTHSELDDPNNKSLCIILYILSLEPSFLADLNYAQINLDESKLMMLGPLSRALFVITFTTSIQRENTNLPKGIERHNPSYNPLKHSCETTEHVMTTRLDEEARQEQAQPIQPVQDISIQTPQHELGYFNGSFLLFRGVQMPEAYIQEWIKMMINKNDFHHESSRVVLQASTCAFRDPSAALNMVACSNEDSRPVLFAISMQNYRGIPGFILDDEKYSAHP
jgi:hypothetical protein